MQLQLEQGSLLLDTSDGPQLITSTSLISPTCPSAQTMQERKLELHCAPGILRWLLREECPRLLEWAIRWKLRALCGCLAAASSAEGAVVPRRPVFTEHLRYQHHEYFPPVCECGRAGLTQRVVGTNYPRTLLFLNHSHRGGYNRASSFIMVPMKVIAQPRCLRRPKIFRVGIEASLTLREEVSLGVTWEKTEGTQTSAGTPTAGTRRTRREETTSRRWSGGR